MSSKRTVEVSFRLLALVIAFIIALIFSFATVIGAENNKNGERERYGEALDRMRRGFEESAESIDLSDLEVKPEELGKLFSDATKDTPYLFYVSNNLSYSYRTGGCVVSVKPKYTMNKIEAEAAVLYCRGEVEKMARLLCSLETELQKLIGAHDLICHRFTYDTTLESNNIYSFLKTGRGTCQGYTWTYMALLRELGIECHYVASDSIAHIWLMVKIDGEWYHSDVTWDDPPRLEGSGEQSRAHLLFSDDKANADGYTDRYGAADIKCDSKIYDDTKPMSDKHFCTFSGDVDHSGQTNLRDLLLLRLHLERENIRIQNLCLVCADADGDLNIDESDAEYVRSILLEGSR